MPAATKTAPEAAREPAPEAATSAATSPGATAVAIGIDIGGTSVKAISIDTTGHRGEVERIPTGTSPESLFAAIDELVERCSAGRQVAGIGIGSPGLVGPRGSIDGTAVNLPGWVGIPLRDRVLERYPNVAVVVKNDVSCAAFGEYGHSPPPLPTVMVFVSIGTGIGGGIVIDGRLFEGSSGMAGEVGHVVVDPNGPPCNCGRHGCVECFASAASLVKRYHQAGGSRAVTNAELLYRRVAAGTDAIATATHLEACDRLAQMIGGVTNTLNPQQVVLGGGVLRSGRLIIAEVRRQLPRYTIPTMLEQCSVRAAVLGEHAGVIGAATLALPTPTPTA